MLQNREYDLSFEEFWEFSVRLYAKPNVATACLDAQNNFNADVNILLLTAWLRCKNLSITQEGWGKLIETSTDWQNNILKPIRTRRMEAKGTQFYEALKVEELNLEKQAQRELIKSISGNLISAENQQIFAQNINTYFDIIELNCSETQASLKQYLLS
ncbi:TIGR02444 family protein [Kordiimonas sp. SCSIO 12610]|uniref:TIGR02444 family protein n=1 Tax=Kordiimonas sp. SCSIO 12610 TaxID=2829597 RepID=UPI00210B5882|nr:TIGR02444 family protein [Kordiimonas sp. SCSIO 12610]UTW55808.1 TIGR02444 family protein [Kordiimonas sp. SCSIO 12610]